MNDTDNTSGFDTGTPITTSSQQHGDSLTGLLRRLCAPISRFCPAWEDWQAAVELYPLAENTGASM